MTKPAAFNVGDRVQLSVLGRSRSPHMHTAGVVVSVSRTGTMYMVLLDGRVRPVQLHWSYLEADAGTA
jgi:hypothetical protein